MGSEMCIRDRIIILIILTQFCACKFFDTNCAHEMSWRSRGRICLTTLSPQPHAELLQRDFLYAIKLAEFYGVGGVALRTLFISRRSRDFNAIYLFFCVRFLTKFIAYADTQTDRQTHSHFYNSLDTLCIRTNSAPPGDFDQKIGKLE